MANVEFRLFSAADKQINSYTTTPNSSLTSVTILDSLYNPAFTEAAWAATPTDAFATTVRRLYESSMELDSAQYLKRTPSQLSNTSSKSQRSQTVRVRSRKHALYASSSASSIAASDKSLTSFPSFSPESPKQLRGYEQALGPDGAVQAHRKASNNPSIVDSLTHSSPSSKSTRNALFDDAPLPTSHIPGALHLANDEHIKRMIARHGAVGLVRQISEDLAQRDAQIAMLRRKTADRERALRKIILECGLSNLDLETRLRAIEETAKHADDSKSKRNSAVDGLEVLITDAMGETDPLFDLSGEATIRASEALKVVAASDVPKGTTRNWKEFLWGGTSKKGSRASSINGDFPDGTNVVNAKHGNRGDRRTVLQNGIFHPPDSASLQSSSRASSQHPNQDRKTSMSLASMALKLVAGNTNSSRGSETSSIADRTISDDTIRQRQSSAPSSTTQLRLAPKNIPNSRRTTVATNGQRIGWDGNGSSPPSAFNGPETYGPVEMDTILPFEAQPPTVTQITNNQYNPEFLTDRFGFIYDQRRKKRQREAAESVALRGRREMLSTGRGGISPTDYETESPGLESDDRADTPLSEESVEPAKRWQDYLKIATFPTELLSHTPSTNVPSVDVLEGDDGPRLHGVKSSDAGFLPSSNGAAAVPTVSGVSDLATMSTPASTQSCTALSSEDIEPVKLLLEQLSEVHDSIQREKTVKWNDFLRKVRAERKREGTAAAADPKSQRLMRAMPEVAITDGEIIGVANLGNKGKVGRAKWNEFKGLVLGGIPVAYRAKIWAECSGAAALRIPGYYDELVAKPDDEDDPIIVSQIRMDINRTLTDNIFFRRGLGVAKLKEVLLAYSRRNAEVGYCQGMNLITACLLLIMPTAEEAFWVLTSIIENILPQGYYDHSLLASRADQQVLRHYVSDILPKLSAHLDDLGIELEALTFQWFLSVFTDCLSAEALFRVWDVVLCTNDGSTFLFQVALALLKLNERQLLQCNTPASIYTYINHQMTNHAISIDGLIQASEGLRRVVKREDVEARRDKAIEAERDLIRQREARNNLRKMERAAAAQNTSTGVETTLEGASRKLEAPRISPTRSTYSEPNDEAFGELTIRTPIPIEEEAVLGLG